MSVHPSTRPAQTPRVVIELDRQSDNPSQQIVIRWGVSRRALAATPIQGKNPIVHLELRIDPSQQIAWILIDPDAQIELPIELPSSADAVKITRSTKCIHIESSSICCQLQKDEQGSFELAYVRTDVFSMLKLPGGRYEPIGCSINQAQ